MKIFRVKFNFILVFLVAQFFYNPVEAVKKPNVILIMSDDQGWGDLGINCNQFIETPSLNSMSREGVYFSDFYVSPLCAPTRASLLTGRYHLRTGVSWVSNGKEVINPEEVTIAEIMKEAGYQTGIFGKWHNGEYYPNTPLGQGFEEFWGFCGGQLDNYFDTKILHNEDTIIANGYITDFLTDKALDFIDSNKENPFFCYIPYNTPHSPFQVPDSYFNKYKNKGLDDKTACIYGMCENIDYNVERIIEAVDSLSLNENTIIIYLSDNGPNGVRWNGGLKGIKGHVDEGGHRVPLIIKWDQNLPSGIEINKIASHIDLLPTICDLCKLELPDRKIDGQSLVPIIENLNAKWDRLIFTHNGGPNTSKYNGTVRNNQYRLVYMKNKYLLYDLYKDPSQLNDISNDSDSIYLSLKSEYDNWWNEMTQVDFSPKPIPVGYNSFSVTKLSAPNATLHGDIKYMVQGWTSDWATNWHNIDDYMSWDIEIVSDGKYDVFVNYCCTDEQVGTVLIASCDGKNVHRKIDHSHNPEYIFSPDRVKRKNVYQKEWAKLEIGTLKLKKGVNTISLQAKNITELGVGEIESIIVTKVGEL